MKSMKACVLLGNTREKSNTEAVAKIFIDALAAKGVEVKTFALRKKNILSCVGCDKCHDVLDSFGCVLEDDMREIAEEILLSDLVVFSSPIYTWFATPPLKAAMDRLYAFTKYPKDADAFNLMKKQRFALIATSGDACETNCDLLSEGINRMAKFAKLQYLGYFAALDKGYENITRKEVTDGAQAFAEKCAESLKS
jgi:multimeric flavodoxin WrbA